MGVHHREGCKERCSFWYIYFKAKDLQRGSWGSIFASHLHNDTQQKMNKLKQALQLQSCKDTRNIEYRHWLKIAPKNLLIFHQKGKLQMWMGVQYKIQNKRQYWQVEGPTVSAIAQKESMIMRKKFPPLQRSRTLRWFCQWQIIK